MMAFFGLKGRELEALIITCTLVATVIFTVISYQEVYDLSKIDESNEIQRVFNDEAFVKWK